MFRQSHRDSVRNASKNQRSSEANRLKAARNDHKRERILLASSKRHEERVQRWKSNFPSWVAAPMGPALALISLFYGWVSKLMPEMKSFTKFNQLQFGKRKLFSEQLENRAMMAVNFLGYDQDTGTPGDGISSDPNPNFLFTADAADIGTVVDVYENTVPTPTLLGSNTVAAAGPFTVPFSGTNFTTQGAHPMSVRLNNGAPAGLAPTYVFDTAAPAEQPPVSITAGDSGTLAGTVPPQTAPATSPNSDYNTNSPVVTIAGQATPGNTVTVFVNGVAVPGGSFVSGGATWNFALPAFTANGIYDVYYTETDTAGNTGPRSRVIAREDFAPLGTEELGDTNPAVSGGITFDDQSTAPSTPDLIAADDLGQSSTDNLTSVTNPRFQVTTDRAGYAGLVAQEIDPNTNLPIGGPTYIGVGPNGSQADQTGSVVAPTMMQAAFGIVAGTRRTFDITAISRDLAGNPDSAASAALRIIIDTNVPADPTGLDLITTSDSGENTVDNATNDNTGTFTGTADVNSTVNLFATRRYAFGASVEPQYDAPELAVAVPPTGTTGTTNNDINVVGLPGTVNKVSVKFTILHTFDGDLAISLQAPNGTIVPLSVSNGGANDNYVATIIDDDPTTAAPGGDISAGAAPFTNTYRSEGFNPGNPLASGLNVLRGITASGRWRLIVTDQAGGDVGQLTNWSIDIRSLVATDIADVPSVTPGKGVFQMTTPVMPDGHNIMQVQSFTVAGGNSGFTPATGGPEGVASPYVAPAIAGLNYFVDTVAPVASFVDLSAVPAFPGDAVGLDPKIGQMGQVRVQFTNGAVPFFNAPGGPFTALAGNASTPAVFQGHVQSAELVKNVDIGDFSLTVDGVVVPMNALALRALAPTPGEPNAQQSWELVIRFDQAAVPAALPFPSAVPVSNGPGNFLVATTQLNGHNWRLSFTGASGAAPVQDNVGNAAVPSNVALPVGTPGAPLDWVRNSKPEFIQNNTAVILPSVDANDTEASNQGIKVETFALPLIIDLVDNSPSYGIAITAANVPAGVLGAWQYRTTDAGAWVNFPPALTAANALHLFADGQTRIRFLPTQVNQNGNATISFMGWDRTNLDTDPSTPAAEFNGFTLVNGGLGNTFGGFGTGNAIASPYTNPSAAQSGAANGDQTARFAILTVFTAQNDAPFADQPIVAPDAEVGQPYSFTIPANAFGDPDTGDTKSYTATLVGGQPLPGWLTLNAATGEFTGTPPAGAEGTIGIRVTVKDSGNLTATSDFNLTTTADQTNDAPVNVDQNVSGTQDTNIIGQLAANDAENDPLTFALVAQATNGTAVVNPDGTFTYTPNAGYTGPDSFTFKSNDGTSDSLVDGTVNITVEVSTANNAPVMNDPLTVAGPINLGTTSAKVLTPGSFVIRTSLLIGDGAPGNFNNTADVTDADGDNLGIAITNAKVIGGGSWQYSLDGGAWVNIVASQQAALLMPGRARVRYLPGATPTVGGTVSLSFRGWSNSVLAVGTADLRDPDLVAAGNQATGGSTNFSTGYQRADLLVQAAPKITLATGAVSPVNVTLNDDKGVFFMYGSGTNRSSVSDADANDDFGGAVLEVGGLRTSDSVFLGGSFAVTTGTTDVTFNGTKIGTLNSDGKGKLLSITLDTGVNTDTVSRLVNALKVKSKAAGGFTLSVSLKDANGIRSDLVLRQVVVS